MLIDDANATAKSTIAPLARHGQLEVDAFCSRCHYNLHGQMVWVDERLNIPVCRCPECGQYYPAGSGVTAHSVWLRRFASILLAVWVVIVLFFAFMACLAFGGMQSTHVDTFSYWENRAFRQQHIPKRTLQPPAEINPQDLRGYGTLTFICLVSIALGFLLGTLLVSVLWHWPRRRYVLGMLLPIIAMGFVILSYYNDPTYDDIFSWCRNRVIFQAALQCGGIGLGVLFGRKLARTVVRTIIPEKPRQLLAFLWRADGKTMPGLAGLRYEHDAK